jgi:CelD/BcsL family acetyltransferase involved in cellulose biosynthesis
MAQHAFDVLLSPLRDGQVDRIQLSWQREGSALLSVALQSCALNKFPTVLNSALHWAISIPDRPGEFLARMKSKHRSVLRKMQRELEGAFSKSVFFKTFKSPADVPEALEQIEMVAKKTYQRGLGVGIRNNDEFRRRFTEDALAGRMRVWVLYAGGVPRAFRVGQVFGNTIHAGGIGHDPDLQAYRLGNILLVHAIDELSSEGVKIYDLGLGNAPYKERFGTASWTDVTLSIYSGRFRSRLTRKAILADSTINSALRSILNRLEATATVRKLARSKARAAVLSTDE